MRKLEGTSPDTLNFSAVREHYIQKSRSQLAAVHDGERQNKSGD
jgi:hypothetical protein